MRVAFANAIFNDQSFNNMLTNDIVSFEQLGLGVLRLTRSLLFIFDWQDVKTVPLGICTAKTQICAV